MDCSIDLALETARPTVALYSRIAPLMVEGPSDERLRMALEQGFRDQSPESINLALSMADAVKTDCEAFVHSRPAGSPEKSLGLAGVECALAVYWGLRGHRQAAFLSAATADDLENEYFNRAQAPSPQQSENPMEASM